MINHTKIVEESAKFLDIATYKTNPTEAIVHKFPESLVESMISGAVDTLDKMTHTDVYTPEVVDKYEGSMFVGKGKDGTEYHIVKTGDKDFEVKFLKPNARGQIATYPTYQGAVQMLKAQVPNLIVLKDDLQKPEVQPEKPSGTMTFEEMYGHKETLEESAAMSAHYAVHLAHAKAYQKLTKSGYKPYSLGDGRLGAPAHILAHSDTGDKVKLKTFKNMSTGKVHHVVTDDQGNDLGDSLLKKRMYESAELESSVSYVLEQLKIEELESLTEDKQDEVIAMAEELVPFINELKEKE